MSELNNKAKIAFAFRDGTPLSKAQASSGLGLKRSGSGMSPSGGALMPSGGGALFDGQMPYWMIQRNQKERMSGMGIEEDLSDLTDLEGGGPILAAAGQAVMPVVTDLIKKGAEKVIPWLGKQVWTGIKKVGKWFGRLFRRRRGRGQSKGKIWGGVQYFGNNPMYGVANEDRTGRGRKEAKLTKSLKKFKGGISASDSQRIKNLFKSKAFIEALNSVKKLKPVKFLTKIAEALRNDWDKHHDLVKSYKIVKSAVNEAKN